MSRNPQESGWYLARRFPTETNDATPVVVRVSLDAEGGVTTVWEIGKRDPSVLSDWRLEGKIKITGKVTDLELDRLRKEAHADGVKLGLEQARRELAEDEARRESDCPTFSFDDESCDYREVHEPIIMIRMSQTKADVLSKYLGSLQCWLRGFNASLSYDNKDNAPMGTEALREINESINGALNLAEGASKS